MVLNEFRQDLVSGEWVLFSTGRAHSIKKFEDIYQDKSNCPFEDLRATGQELVFGYPKNENWRVAAVKNKFPAVKSGICGSEEKCGPFKKHMAVGEHEVIIFKDHDRRFYDFSPQEIAEAIQVYKRRYAELAKNAGCVKYIMIFHNHGAAAGASIYHPHSQIISLPILPPDVVRSIYGSFEYYRKTGRRVYDILLDWELKDKKRIIYKNEHFMVFCPFVSKYPYEIRLFPKESHAHFEKLPDELDLSLAEALHIVLQKLAKALDNPPFNFFIHTAPLGEELGENYHQFYQWHFEIIPHLKIDAGFEIGTGIEINIIDPDEAAAKLKEV